MYLVNHPDGYIKINNGSEYLDTEANFELDYGSPFIFPADWDAKYTGLTWEPAKGGLFGFNSQTKEFVAGAWAEGDLILAAASSIIAAKVARENPPLTVDQKRDLLKTDIADEGLRRIQLSLPAIATFQEMAFADTFWHIWGTPTAAQTLARDTYLFAHTKIGQTNHWDEAMIDAYDPVTDPGWPV